MGSTFGGLEIGKRGLFAHQAALNTTGHNISNADNEHYSRQRVSMRSMDPLYDPSLNRASTPGQIGQGVQIASISRIRDTFYDDQIINAETQQNYWDTRREYMVQLERVFNEPSDNTLRTLTDRFWASWQELANYPSDMAHREVVLERGRALTTRINSIFEKLTDLRQRADREVQTSVEQINSIAGNIRDLNERILKLQALGDNPNDLMDRRDESLQKLSELANIEVGRGDKDELIVFIGEQALVQGEIQRQLTTIPDASNEGMLRVQWEHNNRDVILNDGKLYSLIELRDKTIAERIDNVDSYAMNLADMVNETHRDGFGLNGKTNQDFFFVRPLSANARGTYTFQNSSGDFDLNTDGQAEVTTLFRVTGQNTIDPDRRLGISGTMTFFRNDRDNTRVDVSYSADDTLKDVIQRLNDQKAGVVAYVNQDKQLALKAVGQAEDRRSNLMIRHIEDSGELLVGFAGVLNSSGVAGAFDFRRAGELSKLRAPSQDIALTPIFHPAAYLSISEDVLVDPASIAAARGQDVGGTGDFNTSNGAGDGQNALLIAAAMKQDSRMIDHNQNPEEFYNALIARLGTESRTAEDAATRLKDDLVELNNQRQSIMGVSLDEEMSNMVQFQHSYNAAARMINTYNEMLDIIINRMGA